MLHDFMHDFHASWFHAWFSCFNRASANYESILWHTSLWCGRASGENIVERFPSPKRSSFENSVYCVMPRSSKPPDTCKWGGPKLRGILKFSRSFKEHSTLTMMLTEEQQAMKTFWRTYMISDKTLECIRNNDYHDDVKRFELWRRWNSTWSRANGGLFAVY